MTDTFGPTKEIITTIYQLSPSALEEIAQWFEQRGMRTPASQLIGLRPSLFLFRGAGSPETVITAPVGSIYQRTDGGAITSVYFKESGTGNTGWIAK